MYLDREQQYLVFHSRKGQLLTLLYIYILRGFPMHIDTISMGLPIMYFKRLRADFFLN